MVKYEEYLKGEHECPFCTLRKEEIIRGNKYAVLTLAQAPYCRDHLLVVPRRHCVKLNKLRKCEKDAIEKLIYYGMRKLHKRYKNVTLLYREGNREEVGKSVEHLHYHLIPEMKVGVFGVGWRRMWGDGLMKRKVGKFRDRFILKKAN